MLTVLIVEDEADVRGMAETALAVTEYRTFAAGNAGEAMAVLREHPEINLLFTDTSIAGPASGYGLARAARHRRPDLKVLYATNLPDELHRLEGPFDPAQILRKPYQPEELQRAVGWLLQVSAQASPSRRALPQEAPVPRLFVAIDLPEELKARLSALRAAALPARWVEPEKLHLTLFFLGEVEETGAQAVNAALWRIEAPCFSLALTGIGHFRHQTLWAGCRAARR